MQATSASFGLIAIAVAGSDVTGSVTPTVEAYITSSDVEARDITVTASADPKADLDARGFSVSSGASVGVSRAIASVDACLQASGGTTALRKLL